MARKKDRHLIDTIPVEEHKVWLAGVYTRISRDINGEKKESLVTQKMLAKAYVDKKKDIKIVNFYEDDGITGTKFDRAAFNRMMDDVKSGAINTIIVKDLSRFGRNLDEVSNYLEKILPFMGVRFISINDNYDSNDPKCDDRMLSVMITNMANDMYAKDASIKSSSTMKVRMEAGGYCGGDAPYGYVCKKEGKGVVITEIDPLAAPYVKEIFDSLIRGETYSAISRRFNDMKLNPPRRYARTKQLFDEDIFERKNFWGPSTIKRIAQNRHYLGHTYTHKTRTSLLTSEKNTLLSEEEWILHKNTHDALVSEETFEAVQKVIARKQDKYSTKDEQSDIPVLGKSDSKYIGILKCGECGGNMSRQYSKKERDGVLHYHYYYICNNYISVSRTSYAVNRWNEVVLDELVYRAILNQSQFLTDIKEKVKHYNSKYFEPYLRYMDREYAKLLRLMEANEILKLETYEKYVMGDLEQNQYEAEMNRIENVKVDFERRIKEISSNQYRLNRLKEESLDWMNDFMKGNSVQNLTAEAIHNFISEIRLYSYKRIEIHFKFQDELSNYVREFEEVTKVCQM